MKFLKKLELADIASPSIFSHNHSSDFSYTDTLLSSCLRNLEKLANRINKHLLIHKKASALERQFNRSRQKISDDLSASVSIKNSHPIDWAPLVKHSSPTKNPVIDNQTIHMGNRYLTGYSVLCVGGRIKLYPEYKKFIEHSGGNLVTFHGNPNDQLSKLPQLLAKTDMIICPLDCVNHEAFFIVKCYCQCSGKLCVLLDRSEIETFCKGINKLAWLVSEKSCNYPI
jgi:hypothetical protein